MAMLKAQLKMSRQCSVIMAASQKWHMELKICDWCLAGKTSLDGHSSATRQEKSATVSSEHLDFQTNKVGCMFVALCCPLFSTVGKGRGQTGTQGCRLGGIATTVVFTWHTRRQAIAMSDTRGDRWLGRGFFSWSDIHSKWQLRSLVS